MHLAEFRIPYPESPPSEVFMSLLFDPMMLFKIKEVRRDLRKFSGPALFLILLNLNKLSDCGGEGGRICNALIRSKPECY